jgi:hypothetical protein
MLSVVDYTNALTLMDPIQVLFSVIICQLRLLDILGLLGYELEHGCMANLKTAAQHSYGRCGSVHQVSSADLPDTVPGKCLPCYTAPVQTKLILSARVQPSYYVFEVQSWMLLDSQVIAPSL